MKNDICVQTEKWYISDLLKRTYVIVPEKESLNDLSQLLPPEESPLEEWINAAHIIAEKDNWQISSSEGIDRISMAEGNHRLLILGYLLDKKQVPDFQVDVTNHYVTPENLGDLTLERAMGKAQALHFRFLIDLNFSLRCLVSNLGYDLSSVNDEDYSLLQGLIQRLKVDEIKEKRKDITNNEKIRVFGDFGKLEWPGLKEFDKVLHSPRETKKRKTDNFLDDIIDDAKENEGDISFLLEYKTLFSPKLSEIFTDAIKLYLDKDTFTKIIEEDNFSTKHRIYCLMESAIGRALYQRVLGTIKEKIDVAKNRGSITYTSLLGYLDILGYLKEGADDSGIPFKQLIQKLGGRKYGHDVNSYGPIRDAYVSLSKLIKEPFRTDLVDYVLDQTEKLHDSATHRRTLIAMINGSWSEYGQNLIGEISNMNLTKVYAFLPLSTIMEPVQAKILAEHLSKLYEKSEKVYRLETYENICRTIAKELMPSFKKGKNDLVFRAFLEFESFEKILNDYDLEREEKTSSEGYSSFGDSHMMGGTAGISIAPWFGAMDSKHQKITSLNIVNPLVINPKYLFGTNGTNEVSAAIRDIMRSEWNFSEKVYARHGINLLPDYFYAVNPQDNKVGIGQMIKDMLVILAVSETPFLLNSNSLLPALVNPKTYQTNLFWIVNMNESTTKDVVKVYAGCIYDATLKDSFFAKYTLSSNIALAPLYLKAARETSNKSS